MRNNVVKAGETDSEDYEKALERVYQDMMSRHNDPEIIRMREDNKKIPFGRGIFPMGKRYIKSVTGLS